MKPNRDKARTERSQEPAPSARELTEKQLELIVGGEGATGLRRPL